MVMWGIWFNRNLLVHQKKARGSVEVLDWTAGLLSEFQNTQLALRVGRQAGRGAMKEAYKPPPLGRLKLNTDAAVVKDGMAIRVGAVIRGGKGNM
ncbi:hypothetical protein ACOSP7_028174 [Xanthoceras sorbifolium]